MILGTSILQPRAANPSWPTDPSATDAGTLASSPVSVPHSTPVDGGQDWTTSGQREGYLSQEVCQRANETALLVSGGYALSAALVGVVLFIIARRKLWWSAPTRYLGAVGVAAVMAFILAALDPAQSDVLTRCINPGSGFSQYVFLGSTTIARALVLGLVPAVVLAFVGSYVANRS